MQHEPYLVPHTETPQGNNALLKELRTIMLDVRATFARHEEVLGQKEWGKIVYLLVWLTMSTPKQDGDKSHDEDNQAKKDMRDQQKGMNLDIGHGSGRYSDCGNGSKSRKMN